MSLENSYRQRSQTPSQPDTSKIGTAVMDTLRKRWRSVSLIAVLSILTAVVVAAVVPVKYTAQAKLIAGPTSVDISAVPAFAEAGKTLAESYSRIFTGDDVRTLLKQKIGGTEVRVQQDGHLSWSGKDGKIVDVSTSPVAGSSIILIEATANDERGAIDSANLSSAALAETVAGVLGGDSATQEATGQLDRAYKNLSDAQTQAELSGPAGGGDAAAALQTARFTVQAYENNLNQVISNSGQSNGVRSLAMASVVSSTTFLRFEIGVLLALIVVAAAVALLVARSMISRTTASRSANVNGRHLADSVDHTPAIRRPSYGSAPEDTVGIDRRGPLQ